MPLFSSVLGLPVDEPSRQQVASQDSSALAERDIASRLNFAGGANTEKETPSLLGPTIVGLALGGTGVAAMYYMRTPGAALRVAKRIAKTFNLDPSDMSAGGRLYGSPLKGAVEDLVYLAHHAANDKNLKPEVVNSIVEELGVATKQELANGEKQATIGDLLRQYRNSKDEREQQALKLIDESLDTLRAIPGANKQLLEENLTLGHNVLFEEGKILDYRRYTPEGLIARGLEWSHDNLRVPFVDFAPTDLLMHHGWANTRQIARLGKGEVIDGKMFTDNAFAVGNKIFTKEGQVHEVDFRLIGTNSALARSLDALKGKRKNKSINTLLTEGDLNPVQRKYLEMLNSLKWSQPIEHDVLDWRTGEIAIKKGSSGDLLKAEIGNQLTAARQAFDNGDLRGHELLNLTKQYEDIVQGIGAQYEDAFLSPIHSDNKAALHESYEWVRRIYEGTAQQASVREGKVARDLVEDPLSIIEKIRLSMKGDVRGIDYATPEGKIIGEGVKGPMKTAGFEPLVPGVHPESKVVESFSDVATNPRIPTEFTVAKKGKGIVESLFTGDTARAVWHSMFQRPSSILESLTGFGIRPAKTVMGAAVSNSIGAYAVAQGITQGIGYLNFIGQGVPAQAAAVAGGAVQVGMQGVYQASGIGAVSENLEEVLPGSVNSFASQIGRVVAAPFIGAAIGSSMLPSQIDIGKVQFWKMLGGGTAESMISGRALGAVTATALALSTVFIDPMKGVEQQYAEAIGEKRVAVRNARWWVAGRTPFEGDHIKFFDQSWVQKAWNYDSAMRTTYGSEGSAWANSWFPTPSNLFGVIPLIDPYFAERRNFAYRPYPEISSVGGDIPLFGSAIQATVGQVLKPSVKFDVQQPEDFGKYGQFSPSEGEALGFTTQVPELDPRSSSSIGSYANKTINQLQDLTGVYGFGSRLITENLLGDATGFGGVMEMEGSDQMFSTGRQLEGLNLGGFMGHCFVKGTPVLTNRGRKPIESVCMGDIVISRSGEERVVIDLVRKRSNDIYSLVISNISLELNVTGNHWIPVFKPSSTHIPECASGESVDTQVKDIREGDYLEFPLPPSLDMYPTIDLSECSDKKFSDLWVYTRASDEFIKAYELIEQQPSITREELRALGISDKTAKESISAYKNSREIQRFSRFITIDKDIARLLGWYAAEGSIEERGRIQLAGHVNETSIFNELGVIIQKKFGSTFSITPCSTGLGITLKSQCIPLAMLCQYLIGCGAKNKFIDYRIQTLPTDAKIEFFRAVMFGDGFVSSGNSKSTCSGYTTVSENLCRDVFSIGLSLGLEGSIQTNYTEVPSGRYPQGTPRKPSCRSYIHWKRKYYETIKTLLESGALIIQSSYRRNSKMFIKDGKAYFSVKKVYKIEDHEEVEVFDLTVEGHHYYIAGQVTVHNTEYIRRIFNTRPGNTNYYNPMMNQMPEWLPGSNSSYQEDRQNRNDFHMGDPYTAVELGEVRLPGPGYKAAYGYHGGDAPDIFDKWAILTDLAPGSDAQSAMGAQVVQAIESGNADEEAQAMYNRVMAEQNERRSGKYRFVDYTENVVQDPGPMGQLTKEYLGFANVNIAQSPENPALAPVRQVWDELTHTQIPGLAWAQGKFVHNRTPLEEYTANYVHGSPFADWTNPLEGFTKPGLQEIRGSVQGSDYIPYDTQKRWEIEEYYDKLKYLKARRLETRAQELGRDDLAGQYRQQQQQTIVGMDYSPGSVNKNIFKALDPSYRSFAVGFAKASPEEAERILPYLPNYQKDMWKNIWAGNKVMPGEVNTEDARMRADEQVAEYFSQRALPEVDEAVWNPDVSLDEYKVKTAESEGVSYFTMGIPEAKAVEFRSIGRADVVLDTSPFMDNIDRRNALMKEFHSSGSYNTSVSMSNIRQTQKFRYNKGRQDRESVNAYQGRF